MTPEEYYESQASLDAHENKTEMWDNIYVPDELNKGAEMQNEKLMNELIDQLEMKMNKMYSRIWFLERELNKYKKLYEERNNKSADSLIIPSTQESIIEHLPLIRAFSDGLVELWDFDRDGDDYWHSYQLPDGSYIDINIYLYSDEGKEFISSTAYPVWKDGQINTSHGVTIKRMELG
jgi:hypothetical protein